MTREEYRELYLENTNSVFFTQERYVKKNYPEIYKDIFIFRDENNYDPLDFRELYKSYVTNEIFRRPKTQQEYIDFYNKFKEEHNATSAISQERYFKINLPEVYKDIFEFRDRNKLEPKNFSDLFLYYLNNKTEQNVCITCGKPMYYYSILTCSKKCLKSQKANDIRIGKIKNTLIERYGSDNTLACEEAKKKYNETLVKNHGIIGSPFNSDKVRAKAKETLYKNYGVTNPSFSAEICKRISESNLLNNELHGDEILHKRKMTTLNRYGEYTTFTAAAQNNFKNTIINKYGVDCTFKIHPETKQRAIDAARKYFREHPECLVKSKIENEIYNWISENTTCIQSYRDENNKEIDIFIPSLNIGIEFNGVYWHSDKLKDSNYHLNKTTYFYNKNIKIIHIWETEWLNPIKQNIVKNRILNLLNIEQINLGARKCRVTEIDNKIARDFLNNNHIQGFIPSTLYIGLYYNNEIVGCLSIGKRYMGNNNMSEHELLRSCTKLGYNIQGGFSKMFKYAVSLLPGDYVSYADRCWGNGNSYKYAGFEFSHYSKPNLVLC